MDHNIPSLNHVPMISGYIRMNLPVSPHFSSQEFLELVKETCDDYAEINERSSQPRADGGFVGWTSMKNGCHEWLRWMLMPMIPLVSSCIIYFHLFFVYLFSSFSSIFIYFLIYFDLFFMVTLGEVPMDSYSSTDLATHPPLVP